MTILKKFLLLSIVCCLLLSCASKEKPEYLLTDSNLRIFAGGDHNHYAVLDANATTDTLKSYSLTYSNENLAAPDSSTLNTLLEDYSNSDINPLPFISRILTQSNAGDLILHGFKNADEIYWIVEDDIAQTGLTLYPKNIAEFSDSISITRTLKTCSNKTCESKGQLNISLQKLGAEIVETPYAYFEAYKFNVIFEITIQGENPVSRSVSGVHWLHPAIGVVKFSYDVYDASNSATLIGTLTDTNISIPSRYKKPGS